MTLVLWRLRKYENPGVPHRERRRVGDRRSWVIPFDTSRDSSQGDVDSVIEETNLIWELEQLNGPFYNSAFDDRGEW